MKPAVIVLAALLLSGCATHWGMGHAGDTRIRNATAQAPSPWTSRKLLIGPQELATAPIYPFLGASYGPINTHSEIGAPRGFGDWMAHLQALILTDPVLLIVGTVAGAGCTVGGVVEGLFDTLTGGAFADTPYEFFGLGDGTVPLLPD